MILHTRRQILRPFTPDDARAMFELNADPEVMRYAFDVPFDSVEAARDFLERYQSVYVREGFARFAAVDRETNAFLGWCGLRRQSDGEIDLGYRYMRSNWGRGLATEASLASLAYGFGDLALERIVGRAHRDNAASIRVLEKVGMRFESPITYEGAPSVQYAMARGDFRG